MATTINKLEEQINNATELSSICRGEWCRALESKVDELQEQVDTLKRGEVSGGRPRIAEMTSTLRKAYRNFAPDIHV